jgi:hypothetical protein
MESEPEAKSPANPLGSSNAESTLTERILRRFQNTRIIAYAILVGTILIGLSKLFEAVSTMLAAIPARTEIASFDSRTEESAFQAARLIDDFFSRLVDSPANQSSFDSFREDYRKIEIELRQLKLRNSVRPLNNISTQEVAILTKMWHDLKEHHQKQGYLGSTFVELKQEQLTEAFSIILELEESKPRATTR